MKPEITHELKTGYSIGAQRGFAATFNWMLNFCRNLTGGPGVTVDRKDSDHPIIRLTDLGDGGFSPFAVRWQMPEEGTRDSDRKMEIYLPTSCVAVGRTCEVLNTPMTELEGFENDDNWFLLAGYVNGAPYAGNVETTETYTEDGQTHSVYYTEDWYDVVVHAKTSAKVYGVDALDATARRLVYAHAHRVYPPNMHIPPTESMKDAGYEGDEFSMTVGRLKRCVRVVDSSSGKVWWEYDHYRSQPIAVAAKERTNFDLVWYLEIDENTGKLVCKNVYCIRNLTTIGGMTVAGPTMTEVTGAADSLWVRINTNTLITGNAQNILAVVVDPDNPSSDDNFVTWLKIYDMANNVVKADYRASALVNAITYR